MALERAIALTAFAVGLAVILVALVGCGEDEDEPPIASGCPSAHSAHAILGTAYREGRTEVRLVSPGPPCGYADDFHRGTLYVELRRPSYESPDPSELVCVDAPLERRARPGTPLERLTHGGRLGVSGAAVTDLLNSPEPCPKATRMQASFVID